MAMELHRRTSTRFIGGDSWSLHAKFSDVADAFRFLKLKGDAALTLDYLRRSYWFEEPSVLGSNKTGDIQLSITMRWSAGAVVRVSDWIVARYFNKGPPGPGMSFAYEPIAGVDGSPFPWRYELMRRRLSSGYYRWLTDVQ